ncbi:unnamed protein product, partial [Prorocentrum cordatum]
MLLWSCSTRFRAPPALLSGGPRTLARIAAMPSGIAGAVFAAAAAMVPALAHASAALVPWEFVARPDSAQPSRGVPRQGAFKRSRGRRLQAEGSKPARHLYFADEGDQRFRYEYAGRCLAEQILNVDAELAVVGFACGVPRGKSEGVLQLRWRADAVPGDNGSVGRPKPRPRLQAGDAVTGGSGWRCGPRVDGGMLFEVLRVDKHATHADPVTSLVVRAASPFRFFHDVFIEFEWSGIGRRLHDYNYTHQLPKLLFNKDDDGAIIERSFDNGVFRCDDCFAELQPLLTFRLETNGAIPQALSLRVDGPLDISMSVGLAPEMQASVSDGWARIEEHLGPELIALALTAVVGTASGGSTAAYSPALLPLFAEVTDQLNIELLPVLGMESLSFAGGNLSMDDTISVQLSAKAADTYFEISWSRSDGLTSAAAFDYDLTADYPGDILTPNITAGARACLGLKLMALSADTPLAQPEVCPEMKIFAVKQDIEAVPVFPEDIETTSDSADTLLCFTFQSFSTDLDLDVGYDDPYAEACFLGKCVASTPDAWFQGDTVTWSDGPLCLEVRRTSVEQVPIYLGAHEDDLLYSEQYSEPFPISLAEACPSLWTAEVGCSLLESLPVKDGGTYATLRVTVAVTSLRRLSGAAAPCLGIAIGVSLGVGGSFGGFDYPSYFHTGAGDKVQPAGLLPSARPSAPRGVCRGLRRWRRCPEPGSHLGAGWGCGDPAPGPRQARGGARFEALGSAGFAVFRPPG